MNQNPKEFGERFAHLITVLSRCPAVQRFDQPGEPQAETMAHALLDLEESFRRFVDEHLVALLENPMSPEQLSEHLQDIGEDFRHIVYHLRDMRFYRDALDL